MSDQVTRCINPATGEQIGAVPLDDASQVARAVKRGRSAQRIWAALSVHERADAIRRVGDFVVQHADDLAQTISQDNGKPRIEALAADILPAVLGAYHYADRAPQWLAERPIKSTLISVNKRSSIVRVPYGVLGVISPWNYPFTIPFAEVVCGLLAGNAVVLKVASETQLVGEALSECIRAGGLPEGLFAHVNVPGRQAGPAMLSAGVDKLFFTGSVPVGKQLMALAAERLTPLCLELGGNDAMLVCNDADLERSTSGALWGSMTNCGQSCGAVERIYVHQDVYQPFIDALGEKVSAMRVGRDLDHQCDMGPLTTSRQLQAVRAQLADALARGATIHAQSAAPEGPGFFHPATVLTDVDHTMDVMREETFGPLVGVMRVSSMQEAIELANDTKLGLTGSVWSRDRAAARELALRLRAGVVTINDHLLTHGFAETPWGGFGESGMGRTHGELGFAEMTQPQCVVDELVPQLKRNMWWQPYGPEVYDGLKGVLTAIRGKGLGRVSGVGRMAKLLSRSFKSKV